MFWVWFVSHLLRPSFHLITRVIFAPKELRTNNSKRASLALMCFLPQLLIATQEMREKRNLKQKAELKMNVNNTFIAW